ncbi:MAG: winged helix-turn-helix transcriptional regulator [Thermoleophilia bacterium]|nr:winged helix-turn-helix transcriptional regulator [Thermoleophilia bacterium]
MNEDRERYAMHARVFAALANPTRHELMHLLCKEARTPSDLAEAMGVSRPNVSQHLALLQREGLVKRSRQGGRVLWEVIDPRLSQACALIDEILARQFADKVEVLQR